FNVVLDSTGIKEGKYSTTITIKTKTSSYKVVVGYNIVPQPFVAELKLGDPIMKMKRGTQKWEVKLDSPPFLQSNRTMVPLRAISESFGPKVTYIKDGCPGSGRVDITLGGTIIYHCIGTNILTLKLPGKQPEAKTFDTASVIVAGRTFVPIRFIAEAFLATVNWDANTKTVIITYQPP
ncbi:MAG TPA: copper amine oxidase N-terminal domain-containing protein, partial [Caldisericia bacterium]|nr:copper amine oxidase N-terminal domain-containing protein [Caldisericia bacterium]